jgi:hypothetical protein
MSRKWSKIVVVGFAAAAVGGLAIAGSASASPWSDLGTVRETGHDSALLRVCAKYGNLTISVQGANQNGASATTPWQTIGKGSCDVVGYQNPLVVGDRQRADHQRAARPSAEIRYCALQEERILHRIGDQGRRHIYCRALMAE